MLLLRLYMVRRLLDFSRHPRDVDDPWYTGDFVTAYRDIEEGCNALLDELFPGSRGKPAEKKHPAGVLFRQAAQQPGPRGGAAAGLRPAPRACGAGDAALRAACGSADPRPHHSYSQGG